MAVDLHSLELKLVRKADGIELDLLPLQGLWTTEQYLGLTDQTNQLIEFTDGTIEVLLMPTRKHQGILALLYELFVAFIRPRGGKVLFAPLRVQIATHRYREPDLVVLLDEHDPRNQEAFWLGADLVVEIVSPDNPERDTVEKRADYAMAAIAEYWIVNPLDETVTVLTLDGDHYAQHGLFERGAVASSALLDGFEIRVGAVFEVT
ncbi:MAG: Uma2 family endonuclease [Herpetosiphonaceae bacterium]|nr:Uma2 family endonuclease [Herpetosiphonaceae bacterium]